MADTTPTGQVADSTGRQTVASIEALVRSLSDAVGPKQPITVGQGTEKTSNAINEILKIIQGLPKEIEKLSKSINKLTSGSSTDKKQKGDKFSKKVATTTDLFGKLNKELNNFHKKAGKFTRGGPSISQGSIDSMISSAIGKKTKDEIKEAQDKAKEAREKVSAKFERVRSSIEGITTEALGGVSVMNMFFSSLVRGFKTDFLLKDIAFGLDGITTETGELQSEWTKLDVSVERTGYTSAHTREIIANQMKKGTKLLNQEVGLEKKSLNALKQTTKVMESGLHTSYLIGSNAEQTADLFGDWHRTLGFSGRDMSNLGRGIRQVELNTGLMGDNLLNVVKSAEKFLEVMRDAGVLTSESAKNVIEIQANLQKAGITTEDSLLKALTGTKNLLDSDAQTQSLAFMLAEMSGQTEELVQGTILSNKESQKKLFSSFDKILESYGVTQKDVLAGKVDRSIINMIDQSLAPFGRTSMQMARSSQAFAEASKTFADRQKDLSDSLSSKNLSSQGRGKLEKDLARGKFNEGLSHLTTFGNVLTEKGGTFSSAMEELSKKFNAADLKALGVTATDKSGQFEQIGMIVAEELKKMGGEDLTTEMSSALKSGNTETILTVIEKIEEANQKLAKKQADDSNPMRKAMQDLQKSIENIGLEIKNAVEWIQKTLGIELGTLIKIIIGLNLASSLVGIIGGIATLTKVIGGITGLSSLVGGGAAATGAGAAGAGSAAVAGSGMLTKLGTIAKGASLTAGLVWTLSDAYEGLQKGGIEGAITGGITGTADSRVKSNDGYWATVGGGLASAASGAGKGALIGGRFGPAGAAVGAAIGGIAGVATENYKVASEIVKIQKELGEYKIGMEFDKEGKKRGYSYYQTTDAEKQKQFNEMQARKAAKQAALSPEQKALEENALATQDMINALQLTDEAYSYFIAEYKKTNNTQQIAAYENMKKQRDSLLSNENALRQLDKTIPEVAAGLENFEKRKEARSALNRFEQIAKENAKLSPEDQAKELSKVLSVEETKRIYNMFSKIGFGDNDEQRQRIVDLGKILNKNLDEKARSRLGIPEHADKTSTPNIHDPNLKYESCGFVPEQKSVTFTLLPPDTLQNTMEINRSKNVDAKNEADKNKTSEKIADATTEQVGQNKEVIELLKKLVVLNTGTGIAVPGLIPDVRPYWAGGPKPGETAANINRPSGETDYATWQSGAFGTNANMQLTDTLT